MQHKNGRCTKRNYILLTNFRLSACREEWVFFCCKLFFYTSKAYGPIHPALGRRIYVCILYGFPLPSKAIYGECTSSSSHCMPHMLHTHTLARLPRRLLLVRYALIHDLLFIISCISRIYVTSYASRRARKTSWCWFVECVCMCTWCRGGVNATCAMCASSNRQWLYLSAFFRSLNAINVWPVGVGGGGVG